MIVRRDLPNSAAFRLVLDAWSPAMTLLARSFVSTDDSAAEVAQESWLGVNLAKGRGVRETVRCGGWWARRWPRCRSGTGSW
ncbi:hypothetical protein ABIA35_005406 [Catenulispora sp. MAP12-49]|uniref:hypothetical protein n=1 Tax=Catenulispora sp. MAP12-49 TaxID=3156302 RepID=UPI00351985C4